MGAEKRNTDMNKANPQVQPKPERGTFTTAYKRQMVRRVFFDAVAGKLPQYRHWLTPVYVEEAVM
jgi:hypothetical protein